jgi:hypothetical protein
MLTFAATATAASASTSFVDWGLLGKVVFVSLIAGVGLVVAFSIGLTAVSLARADQRSTPVRALGAALSVVMVGVIVWAMIWGLELIVNKS